MRAVICRTSSGSFPFGTWNSPTTSSPKVPVHEFAVGEKNQGVSPAISCEIGQRGRICRVSSMPSMIRSEMMDLSSGNKNICKFGSRSFPDKILEEEVSTDTKLTLLDNCRSYGVGNWPRSSIPVEELGFSDGGMGKNWNFGSGDGGEFSTGGFGGGSSGKSSMASYYEQMLKSDPTNALLLRNYGKYLQEVEKDFVKAEEYYGRAILACPEDGELLSLYGKLIWETQRDESRAKSYFDQAVNASPDDCTVLGSYASFMWQTDDDDEEEEEEEEMVS